MKKRISALAMALVMILGAAMAAGGEKSITVTPMDMTINGQAVTPLKSDGTPAEVFVYEGATYVPLRYLSELLNIEVVWDKNAPNTAKLVNVPGFETPAAADAADVVVVGGGAAGVTAAIKAAEKGASVLLVEKQGLLGGASNGQLRRQRRRQRPAKRHREALHRPGFLRVCPVLGLWL